MPLIRYPFQLEVLPRSGIYFFYEDGELWGHGGNEPRIVRVGTHKKRNFRSRISEHFFLNDRKMDFGQSKPKPSDRSIFRKNIGRVLLNRGTDPYLRTWEVDFTKRVNRDELGHLRNIEKEREIESNITRILRQRFRFRFIIVENETDRIGVKGLESRLIGTLAKCKVCRPSRHWLGRASPKSKIVTYGLWQVQHLGADDIDEQDEGVIEGAIRKTLDWLGSSR